MDYNIQTLKKLESELKCIERKHFYKFFKEHDYTADTPQIVSLTVSSLSDIERVYSGAGFYLILTDYPTETNLCSFTVGNLKVIYRGHCYSVKDRLKSHLFNGDYRTSRRINSVSYDVCIKLGGKNGINLNEDQFKDHKWSVIVHKMRESSKMMREQAELAFDDVFSRPIASREAIGKSAE